MMYMYLCMHVSMYLSMYVYIYIKLLVTMPKLFRIPQVPSVPWWATGTPWASHGGFVCWGTNELNGRFWHSFRRFYQSLSIQFLPMHLEEYYAKNVSKMMYLHVYPNVEMNMMQCNCWPSGFNGNIMAVRGFVQGNPAEQQNVNSLIWKQPK